MQRTRTRRDGRRTAPWHAGLRRCGAALAFAVLAGGAAAPAARADDAITETRRDPQTCEPFPGAGRAAPGDGSGPGGEALLVLPKDATGRIPLDFQLAPGARIVSSRFSPVLCATVARVEGAADAQPGELFDRIPESAVVVPNSGYRTAAPDGGSAETRSGEASAVGVPVGSPPDREAKPASTDEPVADPYRPLQYGLDLAGVDRARPLTAGRGAKVAVLDSTPEVDHPDLPAIDLVAPLEGPALSPASHGTLVAGIVGAIEGNGLGIAGVAPKAEMLAVPICRPAPDGMGDLCPLYDLVWGLDEAWGARASVVNLAVAGPPNGVLERGVDRMAELGVAVVAAAGNEGTSEPRYPAAYPSVIGVGAIDREGQTYELGNSGPSAEIMAPGVEIISTVPGGGFAFGDGTSLATAHVTGTLALLVARTGNVEAAREALFRSGFEAPAASARAAILPTVCDALAALEQPCPDPAP